MPLWSPPGIFTPISVTFSKTSSTPGKDQREREDSLKGQRACWGHSQGNGAESLDQQGLVALTGLLESR